MAKCKTLVGFGINDVEYTVKWKTSCGKEFVLPEYNAWKGCITRCYGKRNKSSASYVNTSVCDEWRSLKTFISWFNSQKHEVGFVLDKDLLGDGNTYSPETCCFVPPEINSFLISSKGAKGYRFLPKKSKYEAFVSEKGKYKYLGEFIDEGSARNAYLTAKLEMAKKLAEKYKDVVDLKVYNALTTFGLEE